jgi:acyl-CoA thioesterase YciA
MAKGKKAPPDRGAPVIRTIPMPADLNANGDVFGGWVLSQMDVAGGLVAARQAQGRVATVAVEAMTFHRPIYVGDVVSLYGRVTKIGNTSIHVHIETLVERPSRPDQITVTEGTFVYVAIDERGRPRPVPKAGPKG